MRAIAYLAVLGSLTLPGDEPKQDPVLPKANVWAGLTVTSPAVEADLLTNARFFTVSFALVNDDNKEFAPTAEVNNSKLLINGKELKEWPRVIGNGPRETPGTKLKPGTSLRFGKAMGKYFAEPGIYKIIWKGKSFESAELVFRVLPEKAK